MLENIRVQLWPVIPERMEEDEMKIIMVIIPIVVLLAVAGFFV